MRRSASSLHATASTGRRWPSPHASSAPSPASKTRTCRSSPAAATRAPSGEKAQHTTSLSNPRSASCAQWRLSQRLAGAAQQARGQAGARARAWRAPSAVEYTRTVLSRAATATREASGASETPLTCAAAFEESSRSSAAVRALPAPSSPHTPTRASSSTAAARPAAPSATSPQRFRAAARGCSAAAAAAAWSEEPASVPPRAPCLCGATRYTTIACATGRGRALERARGRARLQGRENLVELASSDHAPGRARRGEGHGRADVHRAGRARARGAREARVLQQRERAVGVAHREQRAPGQPCRGPRHSKHRIGAQGENGVAKARLSSTGPGARHTVDASELSECAVQQRGWRALHCPADLHRPACPRRVAAPLGRHELRADGRPLRKLRRLRDLVVQHLARLPAALQRPAAAASAGGPVERAHWARVPRGAAQVRVAARREVDVDQPCRARAPAVGPARRQLPGQGGCAGLRKP
jgi:hypothetical protein